MHSAFSLITQCYNDTIEKVSLIKLVMKSLSLSLSLYPPLSLSLSLTLSSLFPSLFLTISSLCLPLSLSLSLSLYIYIYIYWQNFFIDTYLIEHNKHFCLHIFLLILSNCRIDFMKFDGKLVDKYSIISYFPSTFCPAWGHHQGRKFFTSHVTFVCTLLLCRKSVCTVILCSV